MGLIQNPAEPHRSPQWGKFVTITSGFIADLTPMTTDSTARSKHGFHRMGSTVFQGLTDMRCWLHKGHGWHEAGGHMVGGLFLEEGWFSDGFFFGGV